MGKGDREKLMKMSLFFKAESLKMNRHLFGGEGWGEGECLDRMWGSERMRCMGTATGKGAGTNS